MTTRLVVRPKNTKPITKSMLADEKDILKHLRKSNRDARTCDLEGLARVLVDKGIEHMERVNKELKEKKVKK